MTESKRPSTTMDKPFTLPIIDISPYLPGSEATDSDRKETSAALHKACMEYGFLYLDVRSFIQDSEPQSLAKLAYKFFQLPQEEKDQISLKNQDGARGAIARSPQQTKQRTECLSR